MALVIGAYEKHAGTLMRIRVYGYAGIRACSASSLSLDSGLVETAREHQGKSSGRGSCSRGIWRLPVYVLL